MLRYVTEYFYGVLRHRHEKREEEEGEDDGVKREPKRAKKERGNKATAGDDVEDV